MGDGSVATGARAHRRTQLSEEVATYVRELIISGAVRDGDFLRLEPIAEAVGVSNTPVREGLLGLRSEGFVRLVPRRGFVVAPFSEQDVHDLFWAQAQLGGELAARAAAGATPEQLAVLDRLLAAYRGAEADDDIDSVGRLGYAFHREINLAARSPRLALLMGSVVNQLPVRFYAAIEGRVDETQAQHPPILAALRARDSRKARSLMEEHILGGAERLIESLRQRGQWAGQESAS